MLKKVLIAIAILFVLLVLIGFFLPSEKQLEKEVITVVPQEVVFGQLNNMNNLVKWHPAIAGRKGAKVVIGERNNGIGATARFTSPDNGSGQLIISKVEPIQRVQVNLEEEGQNAGFSEWRLSKANNGTKIKWTTTRQLGSNLIDRYRAAFSGDDMLSGADALRDHCEKKLASRGQALNQFGQQNRDHINIEPIDWEERQFIIARKVLNFRDVPGHFANYFPTVFTAALRASLPIDGSPTAMFFEWDETRGHADVAAAMPVENARDINAQIKAFTLPAAKALKVVFQGNPDNVSEVYLAIEAYMDKNGLEMVPPTLEEYKTDPNDEPDPEKAITHVYAFYK